VADGWSPPLTVQFNVVPGSEPRVTDLEIYIPEIDMANFAATLVQTSCTIRVDSLPIVENGFSYPAGAPPGARVFEAGFRPDGRSLTGWIFGGWMCEDKRVEIFKVEWHAEVAR
jgi:hypothetical protein